MEYPIYIKYGSAFHKIEDAETFLDVAADGWDQGIYRKRNARGVVEMLLKNGHLVNEACFNNAFQNALSKINRMILTETEIIL